MRSSRPTTCRDHLVGLDGLGYLSWVELVAQMECDGFRQEQCGQCGLWAVWRRPDGRICRTLPKFNHHECERCQLAAL